MEKENKSLLDWALHYYSLGFSVIPVCKPVDAQNCIQHGQCPHPGKRPVPIWTTYQIERATPEQIREWFENEYPEANLGIITGQISGITVVDVEQGGSVEGLPETVKSKSGSGGWHFYYRYSEQIKSPVRIRDKTDIRNDGAVIVAPPSTHVSGNKYEWVVEPGETDYAEFPSLLNEMANKQTSNSKHNLEEVINGVDEGSRNQSGTITIGKLLRYLPIGDWGGVAWPLFKTWNNSNNPPMEVGELRTTFDHIAQSELDKRNNKNRNIDVLSLNELMALSLPDENFIVEKLLPTKGISALSGHPEAGKSWLMIAIAKAVASGELLLSKYKTVQGSVLIVDEENGIRELKRRFEKMGIDKSLPIYLSTQMGIKLDSETDLGRLLDIVGEKRIKLLIFDPFIAMHSRTENNAEEMQTIMESLQKFNLAGVTVLFLHHHRKEGWRKTPPGQSLRGSSSIAGRADSHIAIEKKSEDDTSTELVIIHSKLRTGKKEKPFNVVLLEKDGLISLEYSGEADVEKLKKDQAKESILELLQNEKMFIEEILTFLENEVGIGARNGRMALSELEKEGQVKSDREGKKKRYFIPVVES